MVSKCDTCVPGGLAPLTDWAQFPGIINNQPCLLWGGRMVVMVVSTRGVGIRGMEMRVGSG